MSIPNQCLTPGVEFLDPEDSYLQTYPSLVSFFQKELTEEDLIVGVHAVYGWMPRIIKKISMKNIPKVLLYIKELKNKTRSLDIMTLETIMSVTNNSVVGASKLLHFIFPNRYPIWDSHVAALVIEPNSPRDPKLQYLEYVLEMGSKIAREFIEIENLQDAIGDKIGYRVSKVRAVELLLFITSKHLQNTGTNSITTK